MNFLIKLLIYISMALCLFSCDPQNQQQKAQTIEQEKVSPYLNLEESFDINITNLGSEFKGHDLTAVLERLNAKKWELREPSKSEFETSDEYAKRIENFKPLEPGFGISNSEKHFLAFTPATYPTYDADSQKLTVSLDLFSHHTHLDFGAKKKLSTDTYTASNAFGTEITVVETNYIEYGIDFGDLQKWVTRDIRYDTYGNYKFIRGISATPEEAQYLKYAVKLLFICNIKKPWFRSYDSTKRPTMSDPTAGTTKELTLNAEIKQIWLYDGNTGEILHKWSKEHEEKELLSLLSEYPIIIEILKADCMFGKINIDSNSKGEYYCDEGGEGKFFKAKKQIKLSASEHRINDISILLNGKQYALNWKKIKDTSYSHHYEVIIKPPKPLK